MTETWLAPLDNIKDFTIEGCHTPLFQNSYRQQYTHGVVITFVHNDIEKHKTVQSMFFVDNYNHCLATEITLTINQSHFQHI